MAQELKSMRELLLGLVAGTQTPDSKLSLTGFGAAKDILGALASIAGKGKDEVVQIVCREFGIALAAALKEPVSQALKNKRLQIVIDLVPTNQPKKSTRKQGRSSKT